MFRNFFTLGVVKGQVLELRGPKNVTAQIHYLGSIKQSLLVVTVVL